MKINWSIISKYKTEIYGFSILWIMIYHSPHISKITGGNFLVDFLIKFIKRGNCGVDIFLFLSGVCLFFSMKNHNRIKDFYYKRCIRIFTPLFIINGFYWLYNCVLVRHDVSLFLEKIILVDFWLHGTLQVWFISLLVPLYFLYPLIYRRIINRYDEKTSWLIILVICVVIYVISYFGRHNYLKYYNMYEIAFTRIPVFLIGCNCGKMVYENRQINIYVLAISLVGALLGVLNFYYLKISIGNYHRIPYLLAAPCLTIWLCILLDRIKCSVLNTILNLFGEVSLELYLTHILLRYFANYVKLYGNNNLFNVYKYIFFVLLAAYAISKIVNVLCEQVLQKRMLCYKIRG